LSEDLSAFFQEFLENNFSGLPHRYRRRWTTATAGPEWWLYEGEKKGRRCFVRTTRLPPSLFLEHR
jgi:hypothetical protein